MDARSQDSKGLQKVQRISNPLTPRLLSLREGAEWLGLSTWAMRERVWRGEIPVVRFPGGRKQFIDVKDLESFIEQNKIRVM